MKNNMITISEKCIDIIVYYKCGKKIDNYLQAYLNRDSIWTIGFGTTYYPNGEQVNEGDHITKQQAFEFLRSNIHIFEKQVASLLKLKLQQNQLDALVSFAYSEGIAKLKTSSLLKKINKNPFDSDIEKEFLKWTFKNGFNHPSLIARRKEEVELYFKQDFYKELQLNNVFDEIENKSIFHKTNWDYNFTLHLLNSGFNV